MKQLNKRTENNRNSSIELLRIISMIMIIFHHFALHGGFSYSPEHITIPRLWWHFIVMGGKIGVNIFILISGYFLISNKKIEFNFKKIIKLWGQVFFYSTTILLLSYLVLNISIDLKIIIKSVLPITFSLWGFASCYFMLYLLHPFINRLLHNLSKNEFKFLLILQFCCWCIIPTFTGQLLQSNTLIWFVFIYCIAAYIKLHGVNISKKSSFYFILFITCYALTYMSSVVFSILGLKWEVFAEHTMYFFGPEKITILLISITLFMTFVSLKMPYKKWINRIASTTFGVYLLHDNPLIRDYLWNTLFKNNIVQNSCLIIPYSIVVCCTIFVICSLIDWLRQMIFDRIFKTEKFDLIIKKIKTFQDKLINNKMKNVR